MGLIRRADGAGFTLIELMITIAIMALLLLAALPFTRDWVDSNRQMQARHLLWEGMAQTRAYALRNPGKARSQEVAARLRHVNGQLQVMVTGQTAPSWAAKLPASASLKLVDKAGFSDADAFAASSNTAFSCVAFNNSGRRLPSAAGCTQPVAGQGRVAIAVRNQDPLYVDML